jgi:uncharacterized membrane protein
MVFVARDKIRMLDMNPEDAAKLMISIGLVSPQWKPKGESGDVQPELFNPPLKSGSPRRAGKGKAMS